MSDFLVPLANAIFGEIASVLIFLVSFNGQHWRRNDWCTFCSPNKHLTNFLHGCIKILWKKWLLDLELTFRQNKTPLHSKNHQHEQLMIIVHWKVPSRTALGDLTGDFQVSKGWTKAILQWRSQRALRRTIWKKTDGLCSVFYQLFGKSCGEYSRVGPMRSPLLEKPLTRPFLLFPLLHSAAYRCHFIVPLSDFSILYKGCWRIYKSVLYAL